ncbi:hypothetical protein [Actinosynnema sp. ALI-1.44]|uniref:hypothetical protein n=1 Tax=Actinosynnema sp. ALI-1.44 TaxID=1933779 RepID=UPI00097CB7F7|nr:hypothetical protein [Actinosynnema sp. ALI-1.44]
MRLPRVALAAALLVLPVLPAPAAAATAPAEPAMSQLSGCVKERGALDVLILMDESRSLQSTDKPARRVRAAQVALHGLRQLTDAAVMAPAKPVRVQVGLAGFARGFSPGPWRDLVADAPAINADVSGFADRDDIVGTDYAAALRGARQQLAEHAATATSAGGKPPCQALLWFTDGDYDPLDSAPGNEAEKERGKRELCDPNGVLDRMRAERVPLLTVALTKQDFSVAGQEFLRWLTLGCGSQSGADWGVYVPSGDDAGLVDAFSDLMQKVRAAGEPAQLCGGQGCSFELDDVLRNFYVLIHTGGAGAAVTLQPPAGPPVNLDRPGAGDAREAAGAKLRWAWFGDDIVTVSGELPRSNAGQWRGTWKVGLDGGAGKAQGGRVYLIGDLEQRIVRQPRFVRGEQWTLAVKTMSPADARLHLDRIRPELTVAIADGDDRRAARTTTEPDGTVAVTFDPPPEWHSTQVKLTIGLSVRTPSGIDISPPPLVTDVTVITPLTLEPASLALPSVLGTATTQGTVRISAPAAGGCVWVDNGNSRFTGVPVHIATTTTPEASTPDSCVRVDHGQHRELTFRFGADHGWTGRADGTVSLRVKPDGGTEYQSDVPVTFALDIARDIDFWAVWIALAVIGFVPLLLMSLFNVLVLARFQRARTLRVACVPVRVVPGTTIEIIPQDGRTDWPRPDQFTPVVRRTRSLPVGKVRFVARASVNPFKPAYTKVVAHRGTQVVSPEHDPARVLRGLSLDLGGTVVVTTGAAVTGEEEFTAELIVVLTDQNVTDMAAALTRSCLTACRRLLPRDQPASVDSPV